MRTRIILITLLVTGLTLSACGRHAAGKSSGRNVVAAFYPLAFAAEQIGDSRVSVKNLTPAGAEPHDLEISPRDVGDVESADLVLLLGHGFQPQVERAAGRGKHVLRLLDTPGLHRFPNGDPHVWLDPIRYGLIAEQIGEALHRPGRAKQFAQRLGKLDWMYRLGLAHCARREIVTSHEAFAYLAERYHLKQVAITGLAPEAEPTPKDLQHVVDVVRRTHATTVYFETLVSPRLAKTVAREAGARTAVLNPIEGLTKEQQARGGDYFTLMKANLASLRKGLGCR